MIQRVTTLISGLWGWLKKPVFGRWSQRWVVILILLGAAFLRFYHLVEQSFWFDELITWHQSRYSTLGQAIDSVNVDVWPPLYIILNWLTIHLIGDGEFIMRFFPAMSSVMSVALIYVLGKRLISHRVGVVAALILAVSRTPIYFGQEARAYSLLMLLTLLATYLWVVLVQSFSSGARPAKTVIAAYILSSVAILYLHYFGILIIALQALGAGLQLLRDKRRWLPHLIGIYLVIGLMFAPWLPELLADLQQEQHFAARPGGLIRETFSYILYLVNAQVTFAYTASALILYGVGLGLWQWGRRNRWQLSTFSLLSPRLLLILWWMAPFLIAYFRSQAGASVFIHRYFLVMLPAVYLLVADGLEHLPLPLKLRTLAASFVALMLLYNMVIGEQYYSRVHKQQFREAAQYVALHDGNLPGDSLIIGFTGVNTYGDLFDYYFEQQGWERRIDLAGGYMEDVSAVEEAIKAHDPDYIWLLAAHTGPADQFLVMLDDYGQVLDHQQYYLAQVYLFQNDKGSTGGLEE